MLLDAWNHVSKAYQALRVWINKTTEVFTSPKLSQPQTEPLFSGMICFVSPFCKDADPSRALSTVYLDTSVSVKTINSIKQPSAELQMLIWTASSEFGPMQAAKIQASLRIRAVSPDLRCSLIQAVRQEEHTDRKPDPWPLWMAGHAQLKFVMRECSKTQIRLTGLIWFK